MTCPSTVTPMPPTTRCPKSYGLDGTIVAYRYGTNTWIYSTARRGGRVVYAFDVSSINTDSSSPRLLWKVGCPNLTNDTGCTTGFDGIGQTWSAPKILKAAGYGSGTSPMVIFGGGYDTCEDSDPHTCTSSAKGRRVYLLDAAEWHEGRRVHDGASGGRPICSWCRIPRPGWRSSSTSSTSAATSIASPGPPPSAPIGPATRIRAPQMAGGR